MTVQINYLNKSLDVFNTSMVTPIYYVFFTVFVIIGSVILYQEWNKLSVRDILGNIVGFMTTVVGIFQMQCFRDVQVSWRHFANLMSGQGQGEDGDSRSSLIDGNVVHPEDTVSRRMSYGTDGKSDDLSHRVDIDSPISRPHSMYEHSTTSRERLVQPIFDGKSV